MEMWTYLPPGGVGGNGSAVLDTTDPHSSTGERAESGLGTGTGGLGASSSSSPNLDVESGDSNLPAPDGDVLGSQHGSVGGRLVSVGLDLHSTWRDEQVSQSSCRIIISPSLFPLLPSNLLSQHDPSYCTPLAPIHPAARCSYHLEKISFFHLPVTRAIVSFPERSVTCTKVYLITSAW